MTSQSANFPERWTVFRDGSKTKVKDGLFSIPGSLLTDWRSTSEVLGRGTFAWCANFVKTSLTYCLLNQLPSTFFFLGGRSASTRIIKTRSTSKSSYKLKSMLHRHPSWLLSAPVLPFTSFSFSGGSLTLGFFLVGGNLVGDSCSVVGGSEASGTWSRTNVSGSPGHHVCIISHDALLEMILVWEGFSWIIN